jgi:hypothetical protein
MGSLKTEEPATSQLYWSVQKGSAYLSRVGSTQTYDSNLAQSSSIILDYGIHKMRCSNRNIGNSSLVDLRLCEYVLDGRLDTQSHVGSRGRLACCQYTTGCRVELIDIENGRICIRSTDVDTNPVHGNSRKRGSYQKISHPRRCCRSKSGCTDENAVHLKVATLLAHRLFNDRRIAAVPSLITANNPPYRRQATNPFFTSIGLPISYPTHRLSDFSDCTTRGI